MYSDLRLAIRQFLLRDYAVDATSLNDALGRRANSGAGFVVDMPPIPYTGDPFALKTQNCIALIGINPKWLGWEHAWAEKEYKPLKTCVDALRSGDEDAFERYLQLRASYFLPDSQIYYWPYFTKLGGHLVREWFHEQISAHTPRQISKEVFRRYIYKTDFLPWFSTNTTEIDAAKVAGSKNEALLNYYALLSSFLLTLRPRWIQCNGLQMRKVVEAAFEFDEPLEKRPLGNSGKYILCGHVRIGGQTGASQQLSLPILLHGFTNSALGVQTAQEFRCVASEFKSYVGEGVDFKFAD